MMTQWEYDTIMQTIKFGAPALSDQLQKSFQELVADYLNLKKESESKKESEDTENSDKNSEEDYES